MPRKYLLSAFIVAAGVAMGVQASASRVPTDEQIRQLIAERVDVQKWATGIVVGIGGPQGRRVISYGTFAQNDSRAVGGDTVYEIASLTKVFTALLLADMAREGIVALEQPVATCLPAEVKMPARNGGAITFVDLATHTSGLPLRPTNLRSQTSQDRYGGYTAAEMYAALSSYSLEHDIGTHFQYSNWGYGLLGHALGRCARAEYFDLLRQRITGPLKMQDTTAYPTVEMQRRLAQGYDSQLHPVGNQSRGVLDPAGSLYSTAEDLLTFVEALLGTRASSLGDTVSTMLSVRRPTDDPNTQLALGWRVTTQGGKRIVWSNGRADGYRSYMGYEPDARIAVVALANAATNVGVDDIGLYILDQHTQPLRAHPKIKLAREVLDRYAGRYRFDDGGIMTISRDGDMLVSQMSDQGAVEIFAAGPREFYPGEIEAQILFEEPVEGRAKAMTLNQDGRSWRAVRVDDASAAAGRGFAANKAAGHSAVPIARRLCL